MIVSDASTTVEYPTAEPPGLQWWDYQRRWLEDYSRLRVCCKAHQIGMSTAVATEALHAAVYAETTVIVYASQRQASGLLRKAIHHLPKDLDLADGIVRVLNRKSGRSRTVGLDPGAAAIIERWLDAWSSHGLNGRQPIFCTLRDQRSRLGMPSCWAGPRRCLSCRP